MSTVLLDTHVLHWWGAEPEKLSDSARAAIRAANEVAVSDTSWFELAWLARNGKILVAAPIRTWLMGLAADVRSMPVTPSIAATAAGLPAAFPRDPADRIIYATAVEQGWLLITRDERLRDYPWQRPITLW